MRRKSFAALALALRKTPKPRADQNEEPEVGSVKELAKLFKEFLRSSAYSSTIRRASSVREGFFGF